MLAIARIPDAQCERRVVGIAEPVHRVELDRSVRVPDRGTHRTRMSDRQRLTGVTHLCASHRRPLVRRAAGRPVLVDDGLACRDTSFESPCASRVEVSSLGGRRREALRTAALPRRRARGAHRLNDRGRGVHGRDVLPDPQDRPSGGCKQCVRLAVTSHVSRELRNPVVAVRCGDGAVGWTRVPEASVYEHRDPQPREHDVGPSSAAKRGEIHSIAKTGSVNQ